MEHSPLGLLQMTEECRTRLEEEEEQLEEGAEVTAAPSLAEDQWLLDSTVTLSGYRIAAELVQTSRTWS